MPVSSSKVDALILLGELASLELNHGGLQSFVDNAETEADAYATSQQLVDPKAADLDDLKNAMEHAYVSGRLQQEGYSETARLFGAARESGQSESAGEHSKDHWNNKEGRDSGEETKNELDKKGALKQNLWDKIDDVNSNGEIDPGELETSINGDPNGDSIQDYNPVDYSPDLTTLEASASLLAKIMLTYHEVFEELINGWQR